MGACESVGGDREAFADFYREATLVGARLASRALGVGPAPPV